MIEVTIINGEVYLGRIETPIQKVIRMESERQKEMLAAFASGKWREFKKTL